jgi:hypothetical protein
MCHFFIIQKYQMKQTTIMSGMIAELNMALRIHHALIAMTTRTAMIPHASF